jgi:hypothetical protein
LQNTKTALVDYADTFIISRIFSFQAHWL